MLVTLAPRALPETADFRHRGRPSVLRRRDHDRPPFEQIGPRMFRARAMIAGQRMTAHKPRPAPPRCQPCIDRRDNRLLGAARVGNQRRRRANRRYLNHAFRDRIHRRRHNDQLRLRNAIREIRHAMIDRANVARLIQALSGVDQCR